MCERRCREETALLPRINRASHIVYLGMGYNILKGNPQPLDIKELPDPGFHRAASVVDMSNYSAGYLYDNKWAIPNAVKDHIASSSACGYFSSVFEAADTASYQRTVSVDVSQSVEAHWGWLWTARFTASAEYTETAEHVSFEQEVHLYSSAVCEVYKASLAVNLGEVIEESAAAVALPRRRRRLAITNPAAVPLTDSFRNSVSVLPPRLTGSTMGSFLNFVENWGTHFTTEIGMGGKASYVSVFSRHGYSELKAQGWDVTAAAQLSFADFTGTAAAGMGEHSSDYHAFVSARQSTRQVCVGAGGTCPPKSADEDPSVWVSAVQDDPLPLRYELMELAPLLDPAFFPDDPAILDKQAALVAFLRDHYCGENKDCQPKPPNKDGYWLSSANLSCAAYQQAASSFTGMAAASQAKVVYVTGGLLASPTSFPTTALCVYDMPSNGWSEGPPMREARARHGLVLLPDPTDPTDSMLYAVGGWQGAERKTLAGHGGAVKAVAVSPDGHTLVSGSDDFTVKVWDAASGTSTTCLQTLAGHGGAVNAVAISPDGRTVVSGSADMTIKVWDLASGKCLHTLEAHQSVLSVAVTPDGRTIVSGSADMTIKVWDLASGKCLHTLVGHYGDVLSVAITPDGRKIVSGSRDTTIKVWDLASGQCLHTLEGHDESGYTRYVDVLSVAITPDGREIVSGGGDSLIQVWDLASGAWLRTLRGHGDGVASLATTPTDSCTLVSGSYDRTIKQWDLASGDCVATLSGHGDGVLSVGVIMRDGGRTLVSGSADSTVRVWPPAAMDSLEAYDVNAGRWVGSLARMPTARSELGVAAFLNSSLLAVGGVDVSGRVLASADLYSSDDDRWSPFPPLTWARAGLAVVTLPGSKVAYAFGGRDDQGRVLGSVERFDGSAWREVGSMKKPRSGHAASLTNGGKTIHVFGGSNGEGPQDTVEVFDAATGAWLRYGPKMKDRRSQVCAALISEGKEVERVVLVGQDGNEDGDQRACEVFTLLVE